MSPEEVTAHLATVRLVGQLEARLSVCETAIVVLLGGHCECGRAMAKQVIKIAQSGLCRAWPTTLGRPSTRA